MRAKHSRFVPHLPVSRPTGRAELPELCADEARRGGGPDASGNTVGCAAGAGSHANGRVAPNAPDLASLSIKDYHRVVRATYRPPSGRRRAAAGMRAYLPFALLVLLLVVGAVVLFGHM